MIPKQLLAIVAIWGLVMIGIAVVGLADNRARREAKEAELIQTAPTPSCAQWWRCKLESDNYCYTLEKVCAESLK
jgi:hypothetical protein